MEHNVTIVPRTHIDRMYTVHLAYGTTWRYTELEVIDIINGFENAITWYDAIWHGDEREITESTPQCLRTSEFTRVNLRTNADPFHLYGPYGSVAFFSRKDVDELIHRFEVALDDWATLEAIAILANEEDPANEMVEA